MSEHEQSQELQVMPQRTLKPIETADIVEGLAKIEEIQKHIMEEKVDFGTIPGCGPKPTLLKAGAEKLCMAFGFYPDILLEDEQDLGEGHKSYRVKVLLRQRGTEVIVGTGVGECNTREEKYLWRNKTEDTGKTLPEDYRDNKSAYKAKGFRAVKDEETGAWKWMKVTKIKNENPANFYNTCLKIAKKRGYVDATINTLNCSHLFTQDVEDFHGRNDVGYRSKLTKDLHPNDVPATPAKKEKTTTAKTSSNPYGATPKQLDYLTSMLENDLDFIDKEVNDWIRDRLEAGKLDKNTASEAIERLKNHIENNKALAKQKEKGETPPITRVDAEVLPADDDDIPFN